MFSWFKKQKQVKEPEIKYGTFRIVPYGHDKFAVEMFDIDISRWIRSDSWSGSFPIGSEKQCEEFIQKELKRREEARKKAREARIKFENHRRLNPPRIVPPYKHIS